MPHLYVSCPAALRRQPASSVLRSGYLLCFSLCGLAGAFPLGRLPRLRLTGLAYLTTVLAVVAIVSGAALITTERRKKEISMLRNLLMGTAAGAAGTVALNVATYADMAIRGRPSSSVPAKVAGVLADRAGIPLSAGGAASDDETAQNRQSGLGALFGYVTGIGVGTAYGLLRPHLRGVPMPVAGVGVGLAAMAASDIPIAALGVSDPTTWGVSGWAADVVPHLAYGLATAIAYDAFTGR